MVGKYGIMILIEGFRWRIVDIRKRDLKIFSLKDKNLFLMRFVMLRRRFLLKFKK